MNFWRKTPPEWPLHFGLGLVYIYSGYGLLFNPSSWTWAIPSWFAALVNQLMPVEVYLRLQGIIELMMALILLTWFSNKKLVGLVALISSVEFIFILLFAPQFSVTFRDMGLLGAALAILITTFKSPDQLGT